MTNRPIAGAFSPLPLYDRDLANIGTVQQRMIVHMDPRTGKIVLIPDRDRVFWTWFLTNRPDPHHSPSSKTGARD